MELFDTHAHLLDKRFDEDREKLIRELPELDVKYMIECAASEEDSIRAAALAREHRMIYAAVGVHPHDASQWADTTYGVLKTLAKEPKVVAIGEAGLDYHYDFSPRDVQKDVFRKQIELSIEVGLPFVVHTREATKDTLDIVREYPQARFLFHCYSSSVETMRILLDRGAYIALGGSVTFKNAKKPVAVAKEIPLDRLVIETDCPYLAPAPHRGERNNPAYVRYVAEKIAEIRGMPVEEIAKITMENALRFFNIKV
jgi:TatD DNase family protein